MNADCWAWEDAPESITEKCLATGKFDDASQKNGGPLIFVYPAETMRHDHISPAILTRLNLCHEKTALITNVDEQGRVARVWFDVVGITL